MQWLVKTRLIHLLQVSRISNRDIFRGTAMPEQALKSIIQASERTPSISIGGEAKRRAAARARKAGLLGEAARHFCGIQRPTHHDITVFRELFYQLVDGS